MSTELGPYPAYRDSGVEWLGRVPEHWEVRRVATVGDLRVSNVDKHVREGEFPIRLCNYMDVYHNERIGSDLPFMAGTATEREIRRFRLAVGDVLVTKDSEDWSDIGVPALVEYAADDLVCGYHLAMLRPNGAFLDGRYLFQALRDSHVAWQLQVAAAGVTRYGLSQNAIRSMRIPLPPLSEQTSIARFLEAADRRIRRYIRAKERLVELLEERKRALIHEAVTGRIDVRTGQPYPAYRDSGVEWLGKVPEHWEVRSLGTLGWFFKGNGGTKADETEEGVPCVRYGDLYTRHQFHITESKACVAPHRAGAYTPVRYGDVLFAGSGETLDEIGKSAVNLIKGSVVCGGDVIVFRPTIDIDAEYFGWSTDYRQAASQKARMGRGITVMHIYSSDLKYLAVPLPPLSEQAAIARYLDHADRRSQRHISATQRQIALLREYRTRLIADVVTGKLDVRDAAADLPETDPLARNRDRADTIPAESNLHSTAHDMAKEASA